MALPLAALGALTEGMSAAAGAGQKVTGMFNQLAGTLKPFVQAFSPAAVMMFDQAMRDLNAVIGSAVLPMFNVLTQALRGVASILLPTFQALQPVIQRVAAVFQSLLAGGLDQFEVLMKPVMALAELFATLMEALLPLAKAMQTLNGAILGLVGGVLSTLAGILGTIVQAFAPLVSILATFFTNMVTVVQALMTMGQTVLGAVLQFNPLILGLKMMAAVWQPIADLLAGMKPLFTALSVIMAGLGNVMKVFFQSLSFAWGGDLVKTFEDAMRQLARFAILAAASLANLLGVGPAFTKGMIAALRGGRKDATGFAAPQDARVGTDIAAFARQMAEQAALASAGGAGAGKSEKDWLEKIASDLESGPEKINAKLNELVKQFADAIVESLQNYGKKKTYEGAGLATEVASGFGLFGQSSALIGAYARGARASS